MGDGAGVVLEGARFARPDGTVRYDMALGDDGVLRCRTTGFWSMPEADAYLADLGRCLVQARQRGGCARVLVDIRQSSIQTSEVLDRLFRGDRTLYHPRDWRAFVVESRLKMMQLRRGILFAGTQVFDSVVDAERWLRDRPDQSAFASASASS